jgi:hypothetical protein
MKKIQSVKSVVKNFVNFVVNNLIQNNWIDGKVGCGGV